MAEKKSDKKSSTEKYTVEIRGTIPVVLKYDLEAETAQEALNLVQKRNYSLPKLIHFERNVSKIRKDHAKVRKANQSLILLTKKL